MDWADHVVGAWGLAAFAIVLIRIGWGASRPVALAGWGVEVLALVLLGRAAGAWGIATGAAVAMIVALIAVLAAGWQSVPRLRRASNPAETVTVPITQVALGRRVAVFLLVVPVAFIAAQWLAWAGQGFVRGHAPLDANSLALMLALQPVVWTVLITWQMLCASLSGMAAPPALAALLGLLLWSFT